MKSFKYILILLAFILVGQGLFAQEDFRKQAPDPGPAPKIDIGNYEMFKLDNGLTVIMVENHKLPRVSFQLFVDLPMIQEGEFAGAADMAGDLLSKGTTNRTKAEIDEAIDFIGASLNSTSSGIFGASLTRHKSTLLEIMSDVLLNPAFPEAEFEKLKKQTLSGLAVEKDDPNAIATNVAQVLRYGKDHPYGEITTEKTVEKITLEKTEKFYKTYFVPNLSYLVVVGDIQGKEAKELANKYFGKWTKGTVAKEFFKAPEAPAKSGVAMVNKSGSVQSVIDITYPINLKPGTIEDIQGNVMNRILGGGSAGRLYKNIREDKGYTYGAYSSLNDDRYVGYFSANASVRTEVTDSAVIEFMKELKSISTEKVSKEELESAKSQITGSFARAMERPETVARFALNTFRYNLPKDYYSTYLEKLDGVTADDVLAIAKKYVRPDQAHIIVVGNGSEVADKLKQFGELTYYDSYGNEQELVSTAIPADMTAEKVLEDYLNALGGKKKLMEVKDLTTTMSTTIQGMGMEMVMQQKAPNKMAMTVNMNGMAVSETKFDGENALVTQMGQAVPVDDNTKKGLEAQARIFPEAQYEALGYQAELTGVEPVDGKNAYKLEVTTPAGDKITEYYDMQTSLKVKTIASQDGTTVTNEYSDYRESNGIKFPFTMKTLGVMPVPLVMEVKSVEVNKGLADDSFKVN